MTEQIEIREIKKNDAIGLSKLFPHWKGNLAEKKTKKTLKSKREKRFFAVSNNQLIGHIKSVLGTGRHKHLAELFSLIVAPEKRGKGIGRKLIERALKEMPAQIKIVVFQVQADNKPAIELYRKIGFEQYGFLEKGSMVDGKLVDNILMKKEIN